MAALNIRTIYFCLMWLKNGFLFLCLVLFKTNVGQPLGSWKLYFPYKDATGLEDAGNFIYAGSIQSIYRYEKSNGLITFYDKQTALSDVGIKYIDYHHGTQTLAIAYNNSNIDLLIDGKDVFNIPDLKNKIVAGTKNINGICNSGSRIFFATDLGVVVVNQEKKEIAASYIIGKNGENTVVNDVAIGNGKIFAATREGMKCALLDGVNLQDYRNWQTFGISEGVPEASFRFTEFFSGKFYAVCNDTLFAYTNNTWNKILFDTTARILNIKSYKDALHLMCTSKKNGEGFVLRINSNGGIERISPVYSLPINYFVDNEGTEWVADLYGGIFRNRQSINPNGPWTQNAFNLSIQNNILWVTGGGTDAGWNYTFNYSGFYVYENNAWKNFNQYSQPSLNNFPDIVNVAVSPDGKRAWLASNREGLAEVNLIENSIIQYNKSNSPLQAAAGDPVTTRVTAVALDKHNNVWVANSFTNFGLIVKKNDGNWVKLPYLNTGQLVKKIFIASNGYKWLLMRPGSIIVYYEGNNLESTSDDVLRVLGLGKGNGGLNNANINCIAEDEDGAIWVGTDEGIEIFYCARSVLGSNGCDAQRVVVQRDGFNAYLFSSEVVRAIAVDAANRKWVGTNNGVWLISADGKEELLHFNVNNSP
ncbi:MAG: hypothetical protein NZ522_09125, partial [Chitinophagales bacterium]|nr:hypothetical protein [Chitinophagales bacterium]